MIHKSRKLNRTERIKYLESALNSIRNLRRSGFDVEYTGDRSQKNIKGLSVEKPLYSWWTIFWDIVIGINLRK